MGVEGVGALSYGGGGGRGAELWVFKVQNN